MPTLHERFADLAEDAPESPTPAGLWRDGRRRARVRRAGTAVVVAVTVVALGSVGGFAAHRAAPPGPAASASGPAALPTKVYAPSPWLSGTGDTPPGRLSMVIPADRGTWTGHRAGAVGVSAETGAYHFLDIPGCLQFQDLSADGRRVLCYTGAGSGHEAVLEGLLVYDTVTGHVDRFTPSSGRLRLNTVSWDGNDAVSFGVGRTSYLWQMGQRTPRPISTHLPSRSVGTAGGAGVYDAGHQRYFYLDPANGSRVDVKVAYPRTRTLARLVVSPSGRRVAVTHLSAQKSAVYVGTVSASGAPIHLRLVPTSLRWPALLSWSDDDHLVAVNQVTPSRFYGAGDLRARYDLSRLDVRTGEATPLSDLGGVGGSGISFASELLGAPPQDFPAPPRPLGPRVEAGLGAGLVLLGGVALVWWRRRVRP